jgi:hypothetical protein
MKIRPVGAEFYQCGRTDRQRTEVTKLIFVFHNFTNAPKNQLLFPYTALTEWLLQLRGRVYCAVRTGYLSKIQIIFSIYVLIVHRLIITITLSQYSTARVHKVQVSRRRGDKVLYGGV